MILKIMLGMGIYMIKNDFWFLGPNLTGYPGGYPNGFLQRLKKERIWGENRIHICSGTVLDGITIDIKREPKGKDSICPIIQGDALNLPIKDNSFDFALIDPPYSEQKSENLYSLPLLSVPNALKEMVRIVKPGGIIGILDLRVWYPPPESDWTHLIAIYMANRGAKPLRAFSVYKKYSINNKKDWGF